LRNGHGVRFRVVIQFKRIKQTVKVSKIKLRGPGKYKLSTLYNGIYNAQLNP
jgi:hypothetical protein